VGGFGAGLSRDALCYSNARIVQQDCGLRPVAAGPIWHIGPGHWFDRGGYDGGPEKAGGLVVNLDVCSLFYLSLGYTTNDSYLYLIPAFIVFSIWIGSGLLFLSKWRLYAIPLGILSGGVLVVFLLVRLPFTRTSVDPRQDNQAVAYVEEYLKIAPQGAILLTNSDEDTFPLWYYHFGLGVRPDLHIILLPLTEYVWYQQTIHKVYPDLWVPFYAESPYTDWGMQVPALNPALKVCHSQPDASAQYGVAFSCSVTAK